MIFYRSLAVHEKQSLNFFDLCFFEDFIKNYIQNQENLLKIEAHLHFLKKFCDQRSGHLLDRVILVKISEQKLCLLEKERVSKIYSISTSKFGVGNRRNSFRTPLGVHVIENKIGRLAPLGAIFVGCRKTSRIAKIYHDRKIRKQKDYITSRILRLKGLEPGVNKGPDIQSYDRMIYIHGTNEEGWIGWPRSYGCIRMKNLDIIKLFDLVKKGTLVHVIRS